MQRLRKKTVEITETWHEFFCDCCGKKLGESEEDEDGYYDVFGKYNQSFNIYGAGWVKFNGNYCEKCAEIKSRQILNALLEIGFEKE